jgi:hypothetical protein
MPTKRTHAAPRLTIACAWCGEPFMVWWWEEGVRKYHSTACYHAAQRVALPVKVFAKVATGRATDCWLWTAATTRNGYGKLTHDGQTLLAHRLVYELVFGTLPATLAVCHRCDVRLCCNPYHLFLGTIGDNNRDMYAKGRAGRVGAPRGTRNRNAKGNPDIVRAIRAERAAGVLLRDVAAKYGLSIGAVSAIATRRTWDHVP